MREGGEEEEEEEEEKEEASKLKMKEMNKAPFQPIHPNTSTPSKPVPTRLPNLSLHLPQFPNTFPTSHSFSLSPSHLPFGLNKLHPNPSLLKSRHHHIVRYVSSKHSEKTV